ncbi:MAG TPA: hypothetical protein VK961_06870 [Chthoniobacter sp.]|nr:hypothetical protein [Chthoniobacter sp.]
MSARQPVTIATRGGKCAICNCTDENCSSCIARAGEPCHWANNDHTLCSACARIEIRVISSGSDNKARITGWRISASCTMSPEAAAEAAAKKHFVGFRFKRELVQRGGTGAANPWHFTAEAVA